MDLILNFSIEESPDAKSFVFTDLTGEYSVTNITGWTAGLKADLESAQLILEFQDGELTLPYDLPVGAGFETIWAEGIEIFTGDIAYPGSEYLDGVYDFTVKLVFTVEGEHEFESVNGFAAQIIRKVMGEALTYREAQSKSHREYILERIRLKNNLFYAAETGQLEYFQLNLDQLYKMK